MSLLLAGDIGGTKTILRLVEFVPLPNSSDMTLKTLYEQRYLSADFSDFGLLVKQFYQDSSRQLSETLSPTVGCFAIAGPVIHKTAKLTNLPWILDADYLSEELGIPEIYLVNDFVAVGYGILGLMSEDIHTLQAGQPDLMAPIAVIGAGTGLGQCFLVGQGQQQVVYPCEGGHSDFAPRSELEFQLSQYLREKHNIDRISVERVVSGQGIVAIYQFLRDRQKMTESPEIEGVIRTWEQEMGAKEKTVDPGAVIAQAALEKRDTLCQKTLELFVDAYGAEAGNLALKLLPYQGLYIAGGIAAKILPLMESAGFLIAFTQKGRMSSLLERVPVHVILNPQVGLIGAAIYGARIRVNC